jgi:SsrA-binding protein
MAGEKAITTNRKAYRDYVIEAKYEAGIELRGTEVKSLRDGGGSLADGYARIQDGQVYLYNFDIPPYKFGNIQNHEPRRRKRLLLHKSEINRLFTKTEERGYALIPTRVYFKRGLVKVEIGLGRGRKLYDKRENIKEKEAERSMRQALKQRR